MARLFQKKVRFELWFLLLLLVLAIVAYAAGTALFERFFPPAPAAAPPPAIVNDQRLYDGPSTDRPLFDFNLFSFLNTPPELPSPVAVVIENHSQARPQQSGLKEADVVYETVAEGGITRFLAIFKHPIQEPIGPVRSARPYFVDWAQEYGGAFVHVGGSSEALERLSATDRLLNVEEILDDPAIYRDSDYVAPHDAFTTLPLIMDRVKSADFKSPETIDHFVLKNPDSDAGSIRTIAIEFSTSIYGVKYLYDPATHAYQRLLAGQPHHDIRPSNVIVQFTDQQVVDDVLRVRIQTVGTGKALVFRDGEAIAGTWQKEEGGLTQFLDARGEPIALAPGQTWIEVVSPAMAVNYF